MTTDKELSEMSYSVLCWRLLEASVAYYCPDKLPSKTRKLLELEDSLFDKYEAKIAKIENLDTTMVPRYHFIDLDKGSVRAILKKHGKSQRK